MAHVAEKSGNTLIPRNQDEIDHSMGLGSADPQGLPLKDKITYYGQIHKGGDLSLASMNRLGDSTADPADIAADREEVKGPDSGGQAVAPPDSDVFDVGFAAYSTEYTDLNPPPRVHDEYRSGMQLSKSGAVVNFTRNGLFMSNEGGKDIFVPRELYEDLGIKLRVGDKLDIKAVRVSRGEAPRLEAERIEFTTATGRISETHVGGERGSLVLGTIKSGDERIHLDMRAKRNPDEKIHAGSSVEFIVIDGTRGKRAVDVTLKKG